MVIVIMIHGFKGNLDMKDIPNGDYELYTEEHLLIILYRAII